MSECGLYDDEFFEFNEIQRKRKFLTQSDQFIYFFPHIIMGENKIDQANHNQWPRHNAFIQYDSP